MQAPTLLDGLPSIMTLRNPRGVRHPFSSIITLIPAVFMFEVSSNARLRHPFSSIITLMLLDMLARIREMEVLVRLATVHWDDLRKQLGVDRDQPPCSITISRSLAKCSVADFQEAFTA